MTLAPRCNAKTYFMFKSATHLMSSQSFSITDELLTQLCGRIGTQGYLSVGATSRGGMTLASRCNAKTYSMFASATHLISWPSISVTAELLTNLWGEMGAQGYLSPWVK